MADTVWMIDPTGARRGTILWTEYTAIPRHRAVGSWTVTCPLTPEHAQAAAPGWRIQISDGSGTVIAGPIRRARIKLEASGGRARPQLVLEGADDMLYLAKRDAWPTPTQPISNQSTAYDVRTGQASTVIRTYVDANAGVTAGGVGRSVPGLTVFTDPLVGASGTWRARFDPLLEVLEKIAVAGAVGGVELGYRVVSGIGGTLNKSFRVYLPEDRRGPARFSIALRNLKSLSWELTAPEATVVVGGGRGEETARDFIAVNHSANLSAWGRFEEFYDYRTASDSDGLAELTQGANTRLTERGEVRTVEIQPVDTPSLRYGEHYALGDLVTVDIYGGITMDAVIREVEITHNRRTGRVVRPRIGGATRTGSGRQWTKLRDALSRISNLERR